MVVTAPHPNEDENLEGAPDAMKVRGADEHEQLLRAAEPHGQACEVLLECQLVVDCGLVDAGLIEPDEWLSAVLLHELGRPPSECLVLSFAIVVPALADKRVAAIDGYLN